MFAEFAEKTSLSYPPILLTNSAGWGVLRSDCLVNTTPRWGRFKCIREKKKKKFAAVVDDFFPLSRGGELAMRDNW